MKALTSILIVVFLYAGTLCAADIDGNKFAFTTVFSTPNGEYKTLYEGTLEGDTLKGTAGRESGQSRPFEAKRK